MALAEGRAEQHDPSGRHIGHALERTQGDESTQTVADKMHSGGGNTAAKPRQTLDVFRKRESNRWVRVRKGAIAAAGDAPAHQLHRDTVHPQAVYQYYGFGSRSHPL